MKIVIFGGLGYLGSRLTNFFLNLGYTITIVTHRRFLSKDIKELDIENKKLNILKSNNKKFNLNDLIDKNDVHLFLSNFNLNKFKDYEQKSLEFSKNYSQILSNAFNKFQNKKLIYFSSAHVYLFKNKVDEGSKLAKNKSIYSDSKIIFEKSLIKNFNKKKNNLKIIRLANTFGYPGRRSFKGSKCWNLLINQICLKAVNNKKILIKSKNNITQNYLSINKLCLFINHLINNTKLYKGYIINLGDKNLSLIDLIELLQNYLQKNKIYMRIKFNKNFDINYNNNFNYTSKYKNIKFDVPKYDFENELQDLIYYLKNNNNIYS